MRAFLMSALILSFFTLTACGSLGGTTVADKSPTTTEQVYATCPGANTATQMLAKAERFLQGTDEEADLNFSRNEAYSKEYRQGILLPSRWWEATGCLFAILRFPKDTQGAPTPEQLYRAADLGHKVARLKDRPDIGLEVTCRGAEAGEQFKNRCTEYRRDFKPLILRNSTPQPNAFDPKGQEVEPACQPATLVVKSEITDPGARNLIRLARYRLDTDPALCQGEMLISALPVAEFQLNEAVFVLARETGENMVVQIALAPRQPEGTAP